MFIDEPHRFSRDQKAFTAITKELEPQMIIRFGATFPEMTVGRGKNKTTYRDYNNFVYELNACDSFNQNLIKGVAKEHFEPLSTKEEKVKLTTVVSKTSATFHFKKRGEDTQTYTLGVGDSLSVIDLSLEGITITAIGKNYIELSNGQNKFQGEEFNTDIYSSSYQEQMIKLAIQRHFETERQNFCGRVFDGPNGYGKTSIFDAMEFLITGTIKRVTENSAINGTLKFAENFLANDSSKDVIIKAEFNIIENNEIINSFVIAKRVLYVESELGAANCNPKKLADITDTYMIKEFEIEELREEDKIPKNELNKYQEEYFGNSSQNLFFMLYYIRQEDRLDFFKNTEKERVKSIDSLFNVKKVHEKEEEILNGKKNLKKVTDQLDTEIKRLSVNLSKRLDNTVGYETEYIKFYPKIFHGI